MKRVPETYDESLGLRLRAMRNSMRWHQKVVAKELGLTQSSYSKLESGRTKMTVKQLVTIATMMNVPVTDLLPIIRR